jgi:hypothetical protein
MAATKTFANGKPKGISLLTERQRQQVLDSKGPDGRWLISPEVLAVQFGVSVVTIYNVLRRSRNAMKNSPPPDKSGGCDLLEAGAASFASSDVTASLTSSN